MVTYIPVIQDKDVEPVTEFSHSEVMAARRDIHNRIVCSVLITYLLQYIGMNRLFLPIPTIDL